MTRPHDSAADLQMRQLMTAIHALDPMATFKGCSEAELSAAEAALGVRLPSVYRAFLRHLGWHQGPLLRGTDVAGASELVEYQADAREAAAGWQPPVVLPEDAIVVAMHQGYRVTYIGPADTHDGPVFEAREGDATQVTATPSFWAFLQEELDALGRATESQRNRGRA